MFNSVGYYSHADYNKEGFNAALALKDELIEDYDEQKPLTAILSLSIKR